MCTSTLVGNYMGIIDLKHFRNFGAVLVKEFSKSPKIGVPQINIH